MIELTINGEPRCFESAINVTQLLQKMDLAGKRLALERNGEIVPRSQFGKELLTDGDKLEIVIAVGGG